jgi:monoamine oxidase
MIIIIGAGLSGLLTAYRLKKAGIPFKILEARNRIGGRINTILGKNQTPVEMGATWFGSQHRHLINLLDEFGIAYFEQYMEGTTYFQPLSTSPAEAIQLPSQPPNYRIAGGSSHLINTLYQNLETQDIVFNQQVKAIKFLGAKVQITAEEIFEVDQVVLAIPPKLWAKRIVFEPTLPIDLMGTARETHTWMEDSIKVALTYKHPFWIDQKQSGALFSNAGPITEFYDHCDAQRGKYALCGFMNPSFQRLTAEERLANIMHQLKEVFGEGAADYMDYEECLWGEEKHTFEASPNGHTPHENNGNPIFKPSLFDGRLLMSSTETAAAFPGYMDGAVYTGNLTAQKLIEANKENTKILP